MGRFSQADIDIHNKEMYVRRALYNRYMDTRIKTTDYEMTPETAAYLDERIAHIEKMLGSNASRARCEVEIGRDAGRPRHGANIYFAEFTLFVTGGPQLRSTNHSESINGAIDDAKAELERQVRREKKLHVRVTRASGAFIKRMLRRE